MTDDTHLSIGDVLGLLREEFPDVTVSKIRFLESQGLIAPERTPSGYRKFHDPDVERLRWILQQQKEHYLPLKVIKDKLARFEEEQAATRDVAVPRAEPSQEDLGAEVESPTGAPSGVVEEAPTEAMTRDELAAATGLDPKLLRELESYGILPTPQSAEGGSVYDEEAVVVARLARGFLRHGVEARHLRMYRQFAEREAVFVNQLVTPILKQRNPEARRLARETVTELARLGGGLRAAMLRLALREALHE